MISRPSLVCNWCQSHEVREYASSSVGKWPARKRCVRCGAISYVTMPHPAQLDDYYKQSLVAGELGRDASGNTDSLIARQLLTMLYWKADKGPTLDFGAGQGNLTREIIQQGGEAVAFEPYGGSALIEMGVRVIRQFSDFNPGEQFSLIISMEVIEHLVDPIATLTQLYALLGEGGRLVLTTPNAHGLIARMTGDSWREAANPTHLNLFTMKSLCLVANAAGFSKIVRIRRPLSYGKRGLKRYALALAQILGIDGGLRVVLTK